MAEGDERMTGEEFLGGLGNSAQGLKRDEPTKLWSVTEANFDVGCKNQKANVL